MNTKISKKKTPLTLFGFLMITISMVVSIYTYPTFATSGFSSLFFLLAAGFLWFIPLCLISAELGTGGQGWSEAGVFSWGKAAFGERWGFFMIFLQWFQITLGFIAMLYFVANGIAYTFNCTVLEKPSIIQMITMLVIFWGITIVNFKGTNITKNIATYAFLFGILFPVLILSALGIIYVSGNNVINISFDIQSFLPNFRELSTLVVLVSFILSFMGAEASAVHVNSLDNPSRNYPIAIFILVITTITLASLTSLTIAIVIPKSQISLTGGIFETFKFFLDHYKLSWIIYPLSFIIAFSAIGEISSWVNGPIMGFLAASKKGLLPPVFAKTNKHDVPVNLFIVQGIVVTFWIVTITFFGIELKSGNTAFFTGMTLTVIVFLTMYMVLFLSYIYLKVKVPNSVNQRKFNLPYHFGIFIALVGFIFTILAFAISFLRPETITSAEYPQYIKYLIACYVGIILIPHIIYSFAQKHKDKWLKKL